MGDAAHPGFEHFGFLDAARGALEPPVRSVLFGRARFEQHGRSLAATHEVRSDEAASGRFFPRLEDNVAVLREASRLLEQRSGEGLDVGPAAHWLLDNAAIIDEQLHAIRKGLPKGFFRKLPVLRDEPLAGLPRIYGVAWAWVAHSDAALDAGLLEAYLTAYQAERELTLAELWAFPTTLRVVLVENLRRLAERTATRQVARDAAHHWFDEGPKGRAHDDLDALEGVMRERGVLDAFLLQLDQRDEELPPEEALPLSAWLGARLPDAAGALAAQQASTTEDQQSIGNTLTALRNIDRFNWAEIFAASCRTTRTLMETPVFRAESEETRQQSLHALEVLARRARRPESQVAQVVMERCVGHADGQAEAAPSYWLSGEGRPALWRELGVSAGWLRSLGAPRRRFVYACIYLGGLLAASVLIVAWLAGHAIAPQAAAATVALLVLLLCLPVSEALVAVVNRLISESLRPRLLPRFALRGGIPSGSGTLVVIPCMITSPASVLALCQQLEQHYLANQEDNAQFALLSDWADADAAVTASDDALLQAACEGIARLNRAHPRSAALARAPRFLLLHRPRRANRTEGGWIGWERKRGKLEQLVRQIVERDDSPFLDLGELSTLQADLRYIVTLDSDTDMPPGRLRELVGIACHPLNVARVDTASRRVVAGYGIIQPRIVTPLPTPETVSGYHLLFNGECGIDPYSAASSEVYQDVFAEGSFSGKGLLDVAAMHAVLDARLPEERVLSHDLLEGAMLRCAAVSDVSFVEDAPLHPDVAASRLHRWTRGDWQLLPFLLQPRRWGLSLISCWKMLDNLRRSLVAPASLLLVCIAVASDAMPVGWALGVVAAAFCAGPLMGAVAGLAPSRDDISLGLFYRHAAAALGRAVVLALWHVAELLQLAMMYADAIGRAIYRQCVSRRHLLQWTTALAAQAAAQASLPALLRKHWRVPVAAAILLLVFIGAGMAGMAVNWLAAVLLCVLWACGAVWTWLASRARPRHRRARLEDQERGYVLTLARDTWRYYERFVVAAEHHLPPDNVQMQPHCMVAHRTSPTNMGLYLSALAMARRLGFVGRADMVQRAELTLATLEVLPRYRGHFYNWYDTTTLAVLQPAYVSTVDSGNCSGHLLLLARACELAAAEGRSDAATGQALRLAICAGEVRLHALRPILEGVEGLEALAALAARDVRWPLPAGEEGALRSLVQQARVAFDAGLRARLDDDDPEGHIAALHDHLVTLESALRDLGADETGLATRLRAVAARARKLALEADYAMLYDGRRHLLHIGLRVDNEQLDANHYDLLASEARLTSLIAIAKGDIPARHWGALGRPFFSRGRIVGLKSWSGSMFEYLMPSLLLDEPIGSVLQQTIRSAVDEQRREASRKGTPWGISESAIAAQDHTLAYQYGPQGVACLALRRTPQDERVIAPYASAMAMVVAPREAIANLRALETLGARKPLGFIESLDYSPMRVAAGAAFAPVHTFMAHHQAMSLLAMADVLTDGEARRIAMSDPWLRAVGSLLHERAPTQVQELEERAEAPAPRRQRNAHMVMGADPLDAALQPTHLLGNGRYTVMLRANGAGLSRWGKFNMTRWRDDALRDVHGSFLYVQRAGASRPVSLTAHPAPDPSARYECRMQTDRVIYDARWDDLTVRSTVWVSPEDDCEMRQVELASLADEPLTLELCFAAEVSLAPQAADEAHPAFANLFVQASWDESERALYLRRLPRLAGEPTVQAVYFLASAAGDVTGVEVCTDRARWLGRYGNAQRVGGQGGAVAVSLPAPADASQEVLPGVAMDTGLDPVAVIRVRLNLAPHASARLTFCGAAAERCASLAELVDKYRQGMHVQRASNMSHTLGSIRLRELHFDPDTWQATLWLQTLVSSQLTRDVALSRAAALSGMSRCDKRSLWRHGISGDKPVLLLQIGNELGLTLAHTLKRVLRAFNDTGLAADLVVLNAEPGSYLMPVQNQLQILRDRFMMQVADRGVAELRPGFFILRDHEVGEEERATLNMLARVRLVADGRSLAIQVERIVEEASRDAGRRGEHRRWPVADVLPALAARSQATPPQGQFDPASGHFRFAVDLQHQPSRPWVQVLANSDFGCQVSEVAGGYTWAGNSRMHQVTEWSNDPLSDPAGEHLLLHDLDSGVVHRLGRMLATRSVRHLEYGAGIVRMQQRIDELEVELSWCVDPERTVKQVRVRITAPHGRARRLRLVAMAEWFMGSARRERISLVTRAQPLVVGLEGAGLPQPASAMLLGATQTDASAGFGDSTAFLMLRKGGAAAYSNPGSDWTCDRREFFDAAGRMILPSRLGMRSGAGLDACAAIGCNLSPAEGQTVEATVLLGHAATPAAAEVLALEAWHLEPEARLEAVRAFWQEKLGRVRVRTPDPAFDALINHWLPYQTLACRMWARAGFYQAGGAFGYRDQLQDAMAFVSTDPELLARQIRINAARQFPEGDVQHWWHEPGGAGVRTHFSDDRLWLPLALALHVERNGELALLDEELPFLEGNPVPPGAEDIYETPRTTDHTASLYEHAARAIDISLNHGEHGLPLFGTGDWNDGMNRVGHEGRGESVWLAWFLCAVIDAMLPLARSRGDQARVEAWLHARAGWVEALEDAGWDGHWYRRGFFDDGSPLGSAANPECQIDLIAQAWAVLSGAARPARARQALESAWHQLYDPGTRLLRLLDPPLHHAQPSAGYIQAYPPGVRENGGQYNHAAVWGMMAFARQGDAARAWKVFTGLSPAHRWQQPGLGERYAIEPYVMAGDIYSQAPWAGRGGWSWYTGSAGWLMRAGIESLCGVVCRAGEVSVTPCLPPHWDQAEVLLNHSGHELRILVCASDNIARQARALSPRARVIAAGETATLADLPQQATLIVAPHSQTPQAKQEIGEPREVGGECWVLRADRQD